MLKKILFLCTHNSARSIMAEALFNHYFSAHGMAFSAGTEPRGVNPLTVRVLEEIGVETSRLKSKSVSELLDEKFDLVVTVCDRAKESCPFFPGEARTIHRGFEDPSETSSLESFRKVRDEILSWIRDELVKEL